MTTAYRVQGPDPLLDHRQEEYYVDVLDGNEQLQGRLKGFMGGTVEQDVDTEIREGGSINVLTTSQEIDWLSYRFRPWYAGSAGTWPLGVFLIDSPVMTMKAGVATRNVKLLGKLEVLRGDALDGSYSLSAGQNVVEAVRSLIQSAGESAVSITPSSETLNNGLTWVAGTTKLRVINDLLKAIGYFSLHCDGYGRFRVEPYKLPLTRGVSWVFDRGETSLHLPEWEREEDLGNVPNKVVLVGEASEGQEAMVAKVSNVNPNSPYSQPRRGRVITHTEDGVEATSQAVLDGLAMQRLVELSTSVANRSVSHAMLPLELNHLVEFRPRGYEVMATIRKQTFTLKAGSLVASSWREVVQNV